MMPITTAAELKAKIAELEGKTKANELTLKGQFQQTKTALKPQNVIRNTFSSLGENPEVKKVLISTLIGFGLGYFSKKATQVMHEDNLNRLVSGVIDHTLDKVVQRNPQGLLAQGIHMTRHIAREKGIKFFS